MIVNDGRRLEALVAFVEQELVPAGFAVKSNTDVRNDQGVQIAEFDIEIRGQLGTTEIGWLIECRDRPSEGPAPGSWIEQLVGRRQRFQFNRVTAVSTTGFAAPAIQFARESGIELRGVKSLTPDDFSDWLALRHMTLSGAIPYDDPAPELVFPSRSFVLTGQFVYGSRKIVSAAIEERGGIVSSGCSGKTNYLVIGLFGSDEWLHSTHGTKILKAVELKRAGKPLAIVTEKHWTAHVQ